MLNAKEKEILKRRLAETRENLMYYQELKIRLDDSDTVPCTKKEATQAYFEYALAYDTLLDLAKSLKPASKKSIEEWLDIDSINKTFIHKAVIERVKFDMENIPF